MGSNHNNDNLEHKLQAGKLFRHVNSLIVAHLRDNNLNQVLFPQLFGFIYTFNLLKLLTFFGFLENVGRREIFGDCKYVTL